MKTILICILILMINSTISLAWYETQYDVIKTEWPNGNPKEYTTRYWFMGNEKGFRPHGQHRLWYENGNLKEEKYYDQNSGIGSWIKWSDDGKRIEEIILLEDKPHGIFIQWHPDGNVKTFGSYKNGLKHGLWTFRRSGDDMNNWWLYVDSVKFFLNDTLAVDLGGPESESIHNQNFFFNEQLGDWIEWGEHNSVHWKDNYTWFEIGKKINGKRDGKWIKYNQQGEIRDINFFKDGELVLLE